MAANLAHLTPPSFQLRTKDPLAEVDWSNRLVSLGVVQNAGIESDQLSMILDNRATAAGSALVAPSPGTEIEVKMGYAGGLESLGLFQIDHITLSGSADGETVAVSAVPRLLLNEVSQTWADTTIGDLVDTIASRNGLLARVSRRLESRKISVENQVRETDLAFLTRLAIQFDAIAKPAAGRLLFLAKGEARTASGASLTPVGLSPHQIESWSCTLSDRPAYDRVVASWHDLGAAAQEQVSAGVPNGERTFRMNHVFSSAAEAKTAAEAKLRELNRERSTLVVRALGDPGLTAEGEIRIGELNDLVDGTWLIQSVRHTLDAGGYRCDLEAYR